MLSPSRAGRVFAIALIQIGLFASALPASADPSERSTEEAERFTWRRDAPYGELGFPGDAFGPYWEYLRLATHQPCQEELDLSSAQIEELHAVYKGLMSAQVKWNEGGEVLKPQYEKARSILTEEQSLRIEQIKLQRRGIRAFWEAKVQETLDMEEKQIETIRAAWDEHVAKAKQGWKGDEGRRSYHRVWKRALETLSESQRHKFYDMTGPLVDVRR